MSVLQSAAKDPYITDPYIEAPCIAYIALGSNLGDREQYLRSAIAALRNLGELRAVSSLYETEPVGAIPQPDFLNAVAELQTRLQPEDLLTALLGIERENGRDRSASPPASSPKGPRTLDLDLLAYDSLVLRTSTLTLPHPALAERYFVLIPLVEIAPEWRHPVSGKTAAQMLVELDRENSKGPKAVRQISKRWQSS